jgi:CRP/FNR family transcriptional regulator, cyclic AMP receptor protein
MVVRPMGAAEPLPLVVVRAGHAAVRQGEPCPDLWAVESGLFEARVVSQDGRSFLFDLLGPGDPIGGLGEAPSPWTATALRPARLLPIRGDDAPLAMMASAQRATAIASELAWFSVSERIERRLVDLARRFGRPVGGGMLIPVRLTQDDLASMVGATRETANRALARLLARGAIERQSRGRYVVRSQLRLVAS